MASRSIFVDIDVSVLAMLRLDDADNILIGRLDTLWKYQQMLLARLSKADASGVRLHLKPDFFNMDADVLALLKAGASLTLWEGSPPGNVRRFQNLTLVNRAHADRSHMREGYLVIVTPTWSRILAAWQDEDRTISGVLITNAQMIGRVVAHLDSVVQSATR